MLIILFMRVYVFLYRLRDLYVSIRLFTGEISPVLKLIGYRFQLICQYTNI